MIIVKRVYFKECSENGIDIERYHDSLGTIGHGNHFAELQCIEEIRNEELSKELGLSQDFLYLMIHSGSRGLGNDVLNIHCQKFGNKGIDINKNKEEFDKYMNLHNNALKWAKKIVWLLQNDFYLTLALI